MAPQEAPVPEHGIVFYDGTCGFCDWSVQWLLRHDEQGAFVFAPLQGSTAERYGVSPVGHDPTSIVLVLPGAVPTRLERSDAVLAILARLGQPWRTLALARAIPRLLRDPFYRLFARYRYLVSGRIEACRVPAPEDRARFLA
jgi:predicted DCC family thiol-disulfide oxidoreductase YuxK